MYRLLFVFIFLVDGIESNRIHLNPPITVPLLPRKPPILDTLIVHVINSNLATTTTTTSSGVNRTADLQQNSTQQSTTVASTNRLEISCPEGRYWNSRTNQCVNCSSECPTGALLVKACNRTNDLQCSCPKGSYMSVVDNTCKPCSECSPGWGVWRTCRWSRNTVCRKCQPGTYSGASVKTLGCIPCTRCGPNQELLSECDGNRDTVCVDRATLVNYSLYFNSEERPSLLNEIESRRNSLSLLPDPISISPTTASGTALPLYFAVLVVIVFTLLIYAVFQLRCHVIPNPVEQCNVPKMFGPPVVVTASSGQTESPPPVYCPSSHQQVLQQQQVSSLWIPAQPQSLMDLYPQVKPKRKSHDRLRYKAYYELLYAPNLTDHSPLTSHSQLRLVVEKSLANNSESWKLLARQLGYDNKQINEYETKSLVVMGGQPVSVDAHYAARLLLTDWFEQNLEKSFPEPEAKLDHLCQALIRIGRVDCARLVSPQHFGPSGTAAALSSP